MSSKKCETCKLQKKLVCRALLGFIGRQGPMDRISCYTVVCVSYKKLSIKLYWIVIVKPLTKVGYLPGMEPNYIIVLFIAQNI